ncbi:MAG: undecaprenyl-phosphate glucose phosphotransferase [Bacteroides sp.]|nr:undecaprenyl-phosphate glucose phosphotransferase [Bacteroides sp.]
MEQSPYEKSEMFRMSAIIGDFVLLNLCMTAAYFLVNAFEPRALDAVPFRLYVLLSNLSYLPGISLIGVVLHRRVVRPEQIVGRLVGVILLHTVVFFTALALMKTVSVSRTYLFAFYGVFTVCVITWRLVLRHLVKAYRCSGRNLRRVVLIGGGESMEELQQLMRRKDYGYKVEGVFDSAHVGEVLEWIAKNPVDELYCSLSTEKHRDNVLELINYCENHLIRFYIVPYVRNYVKRQLELQLLGEVPVLSLHHEPLQRPGNRFVKRTFDLLISTLFLCTVFPILYIIVGIAIKLSSPGPIFFKQARNGENGKIFQCYKFRSMKQNKDADKLQATKDDPRKTKVGNFLRKSNIDELPQFINVFKGEMSIVGPRPHMLKHTEEYSALINKFMMRHMIKPGITGWAQVTGFRGETKELSQMEGRVRRDLWYIENWTFLLDLRIMVMTVTNMFRGEKNAY